MEQITFNPNNEPYYSEDFVKGFKCGAQRQFEADKADIPTWIPCSERLPESQGYYICTCKDGSKYKRATVVKWLNGWQLTGARAYWIVLAWMPLPKPWKGADDD